MGAVMNIKDEFKGLESCQFWRHMEKPDTCCLQAMQMMAEIESWPEWRRNLWIERSRHLIEKEGLDMSAADLIAFDHYRPTSLFERTKANEKWEEWKANLEQEKRDREGMGRDLT